MLNQSQQKHMMGPTLTPLTPDVVMSQSVRVGHSRASTETSSSGDGLLRAAATSELHELFDEVSVCMCVF